METTRKDVIVVGGGPAGICAAIAAARMGADTLLVERYGFLGGNATFGLPIFTFHDFRGQQVVRGLAQEIVDELVKLGGCPGHIPTPGTHHATYTLIDPELMKYVAMKLVLGSGAKLLLHTFLADTLVEGQKVQGVVVCGKSGLQRLRAKVIVDATGDGDVAARGGADYEKGDPETGLMQAMTLEFRMGNVDLDVVAEHFKDGLIMATRPGESRARFLRAQGDFTPWADAVKKEGLFDDPKHKIWLNSLRPREANINVTRVLKRDASDAWDLTQAEIEGREQMMTILRFLQKYVPGFQSSYLISSGPHIGVRETRRITGEYVLTEDDVLAGRAFSDGIACGDYPIDIHSPHGEGWVALFVKDGRYYQIPYRCLVPRDLDDLLVAGRCISTTHASLGSTRVMATCMALGQAAGTAAALAAKGAVTPRAVNVGELRQSLLDQGAFLGAETG